MLKQILFLALIWLLLATCTPVTSQQVDYTDPKRIADSIQQVKNAVVYKAYCQKRDVWTDSLIRTMSLEQKIGQLFMIAAFSNQDESAYKQIDFLIKNHHVGGLIFFQGGPLRQAVLTNRYQKLSKIPLLIGMDAEWGLGMRLDSTISYPRQMILGACAKPELIYKMGHDIALQCKRLGVHINFAPVVDVNNNPSNPVIGTRAFGQNKESVAEKGSLYAKGMQHQKVIAVAKHFPGHGDTDKDSHYTLPVINQSIERFKELELYPFRRLFKDSVQGVMVAHLQIPAYDSARNTPTTLSKRVVTELLQEEMGYQGLIFTDAMNMKGLSDYYGGGEADLKAFMAGNDVLLYPESVSKGVEAIKKALKDSLISMAELDKRVRKILNAKYFVGLNQYKPIAIKGLQADLNKPIYKALCEEIYENSVTIVRDQPKLLPFSKLDTLNFGAVVIGKGKNSPFQKMLDNYARFEHWQLADKNFSIAQADAVMSKAQKKKVVIVGLFGVDINKPTANFGISEGSKKFIEELSKKTKVVLVVFGNAYSLKYFDALPTLVAAYTDDKMMQNAVPQVLFGAIEAGATLPVTASEAATQGSGLQYKGLGKMRHSDVPERVGMSTQTLKQNIEWLTKEAMLVKATPGMQVLVAKDGMIIYNKGFGHYTYDKKDTVDENTVYDLASLTKVMATLPVMMKLVEQNLIALDEPIVKYFPDLSGTNKARITVRQLLSHHSGLPSLMPSWHKTSFSLAEEDGSVTQNQGDTAMLRYLNKAVTIQDVDKLFWNWFKTVPLRVNKGGSPIPRYGDVNFYVLKRLAEQVTQKSLEELTNEWFYAPLGLASMTFNPLKYYDNTYIAPTEMDIFVRKRLLKGEVHDYSAALLGGINGNAGVFSKASDVAVLMQIFLNKGEYGGIRFFKPETIALFNKKHFAYNRRALGWDKPVQGSRIPVTNWASLQTFGHTGFTGTCVWADPKHNLIYVFLCNRIYPSYQNRLLIAKGFRTRIHDGIYKSLF